MERFENINKNLFAALCSVLNAKGANIEMDVSFIDGKSITLDIPYVGTGIYNGNEGFYF